VRTASHGRRTGALGRHPRQLRESLSRRARRRVRPLGALRPHCQDAAPAPRPSSICSSSPLPLSPARCSRRCDTLGAPSRASVYSCGCRPKLDTVLTSGRQVVFCGLESSPSSTASSAWRHAATAAEARPSPTAEKRNVAVEHGDGRILCITTSRTRQRETYTALTSRGARAYAG